MLRWWLLFGFLTIPIVELALLIEVGRSLGTWVAITLVVGTGAIGASLAHSQGIAVLGRIRRELSAGRMPGAELLHGMLVLVGAILLILPGLLTDVCGFFLLWRKGRQLIIHKVQRWLLDGLEKGTIRVYFRF